MIVFIVKVLLSGVAIIIDSLIGLFAMLTTLLLWEGRFMQLHEYILTNMLWTKKELIFKEKKDEG